MKLIHQPTGTTSENHLSKEFQFTVISSNKNQKIQWLIARLLDQWSIKTPQRSDCSGVILGHIEKAPPVSAICTAARGEILFWDFAYILLDTVHLVCCSSVF